MGDAWPLNPKTTRQLCRKKMSLGETEGADVTEPEDANGTPTWASALGGHGLCTSERVAASVLPEKNRGKIAEQGKGYGRVPTRTRTRVL